ncbi:MAG: hypothetical protein ACXVH2_07720 [Methanobacterium sp.]
MLCVLIFSGCNSELPKEKNVSSNAKNHLLGQYASKTNGIYRSFTFKGENSVFVDFIEAPFTTSYGIEGDTVRILTDKNELLLKVKDDNTLIEEGGGVYLKTDSLPKNDSKHF